MEEFLQIRLQQLRSRGEFRSLPIREVAPDMDFSSNDYLGLSNDPALVSAATQISRVGSCSSRLISGTQTVHLQLEKELAEFFNQQDALVFGAGYLANLGVLSSFASKKDVYFSDKLIHSSLLDGIRLSTAHHRRFSHNDLEHLETLLKKEQGSRTPGAQFFIVVESVYSMNGDIAPLESLHSLAKQFDAQLIVDEAHAIGVFGDCGRGVCNAKSVNDDNVCLLGTMSKALGCYGGIFSGSNLAKSYLINTSRPFIFNTALPPIIASPARAALKILRENPELGSKVQSSASLFRTRLLKAGLDCCGSQSHIVPILIGDNRKCLVFSELLYEQGFSALAIRPPTVPQGTARLRFSITANHRPEILDRLAELVIATASKLELN